MAVRSTCKKAVSWCQNEKKESCQRALVTESVDYCVDQQINMKH